MKISKFLNIFLFFTLQRRLTTIWKVQATYNIFIHSIQFNYFLIKYDYKLFITQSPCLLEHTVHDLRLPGYNQEFDFFH